MRLGRVKLIKEKPHNYHWENHFSYVYDSRRHTVDSTSIKFYKPTNRITSVFLTFWPS